MHLTLKYPYKQRESEKNMSDHRCSQLHFVNNFTNKSINPTHPMLFMCPYLPFNFFSDLFLFFEIIITFLPSVSLLPNLPCTPSCFPSNPWPHFHYYWTHVCICLYIRIPKCNLLSMHSYL